MTPRKILIMIAAGWFWSALCATSTLKGGNHVVYKKGSSQCGPSIPDELNEYIHSLMITTCNYILPLVVMSYCYYNIFREIHEHMIRIRETSNVDLENSLAQQRRISSTLFLVLACFLVCWTPFIIYSCSAAFSKDKGKIPLLANPLAYWCGYMNSACNPIIYALRSPSFRQGYKEIICSYSGYNIGGSIVTRPSFGTYGTVKKSPTRMTTLSSTERFVKTSQKETSGLTESSGIIDRRRQKRKADIHVPKLVLKSQPVMDFGNNNDGTLNTESGGNLLCKNSTSESSNKRRSYKNIPRRAVSLEDVTSHEPKITPALVRRSLSLNSSIQGVRIGDSGNEIVVEKLSQTSESPCSKSPLIADCIRLMGSYSTIGKGTNDSNSSDEQSPQCPIVVIDEASLHSVAFYEYNYQERKLSNASAELSELKNPSFATLAEISATDIVEGGKWSPISTKSLEMGRSRKNSAKLIKEYARIAMEGRNSGAKSKDKLDSPLYTASKEQLMKWMSQDFLDRIRTDRYENPISSHNLGRRWLSFKRRVKSTSTSLA